MAGERWAAKDLISGRHVQRSKDDESVMLKADVEASLPAVCQSKRKKMRSTRLTGYITPVEMATGDDVIGLGES